MSAVQIFMTLAAFCYLGAASSYALEGQKWMAITMILYMSTIYTLYMAGTK